MKCGWCHTGHPCHPVIVHSETNEVVRCDHEHNDRCRPIDGGTPTEEEGTMPKADTSPEAVIYREVMAKIKDGEPVSKTAFNKAVKFAKDHKRKVPVTNLFSARGDNLRTAKKTTKKAAAKKAGSPRTQNQGATCKDKDCEREAVSKGLCSAHYVAERRKDPAVREAAREAARKYQAKKKAEKAAAAK